VRCLEFDVSLFPSLQAGVVRLSLKEEDILLVLEEGRRRDVLLLDLF